MPTSTASSGSASAHTVHQPLEKKEQVNITELNNNNNNNNSNEVGEVPPAPYPGSTHSITGPIIVQDGLPRALSNRQIQLITMGGAVGTALFLSIGTGLAMGGPLSMVIAWVLYALNLSQINNGLAEMIALYPVEGGFVRLAEHMVDPAFGLMAGINFFLYEAILIPFVEITAINTVLGYWIDWQPAGWVVITGVIALYAAFNILNVKFYGESEFWLSSGKVALLILLFSFTFFTMCGANPELDSYGFRYWKDPGPMAEYRSTGHLGRFEGFLGALWSAAFAIVGPEYVASVAAEVARPRVTIKAAFKTIYWRCAIFFVFSAVCVGIVPYNDRTLVDFVFNPKAVGATAASSPYVIAMDNLKIHGLPHLVNALMLTSIFSAGNTYSYVATRNLYGMALEGKMPKVFTRVLPNGVPYMCFTVVFGFSCLAYLGGSAGSAKILGYLTSVITGGGIINYAIMCVTYLRFHQACSVQGVDRRQFLYYGRFQPYGTYVALLVELLIILFVGYTTLSPFRTIDFFTHYSMLIVAAVTYFGWKFWHRTSIVAAHDVDLVWVKPKIDEYEAALEGSNEGFWREVLELFRFGDLRRRCQASLAGSKHHELLEGGSDKDLCVGGGKK